MADGTQDTEDTPQDETMTLMCGCSFGPDERVVHRCQQAIVATLHLTFDDTTGVIGKPSEREGYYTLTMVDNENRTVKMRVHRDTLAQLADVTAEGVENA